jgi:hypothetical protein
VLHVALPRSILSPASPCCPLPLAAAAASSAAPAASSSPSPASAAPAGRAARQGHSSWVDVVISVDSWSPMFAKPLLVQARLSMVARAASDARAHAAAVGRSAAAARRQRDRPALFLGLLCAHRTLQPASKPLLGSRCFTVIGRRRMLVYAWSMPVCMLAGLHDISRKLEQNEPLALREVRPSYRISLVANSLYRATKPTRNRGMLTACCCVEPCASGAC